MRQNQLKQKIKQGETVLGLFMNCAYPAFTEICGHAGFDFAVIDMEHGPLHPLAAEDLCRAADCTGIAPIIRVRKNDGSQIQRALDIGSAGVQVPQIESKLDAETAVKALNTVLWARGAFPSLRGREFTRPQVQILPIDSTKNP